MSDTENTSAAQNKVNWSAIVTDMVIIVAIMAALAYACNLLMKPFESVSPTDSLVSLIRKGDNDGTKDAAFLKELEKGLKTTPDFANTQDNTGRTPLMWAVYANFNDPAPALQKDVERVYYVRTLLATPGIKPTMEDKDGFTALHWAAWSGMPLCTVLLADAGLDINQQDSNGYTPLMLAAMRGNEEVAQILLALGAKDKLVNSKGETAAQIATASEGAYNKRRNWPLIFSDNREKSYCITQQDIDAAYKDGPAGTTASELCAKLLSPEALAERKERLGMKDKAPKNAPEPPSATPALESEESSADPV